MTRIEREQAVIGRMIHIYCRRRHKSQEGTMCEDCTQLLEYALRRLSQCPAGNRKSSCRKCKIHCYAPDKRRKIKEVMRYVGPRMILYHPAAALRHLIDELR